MTKLTIAICGASKGDLSSATLMKVQKLGEMIAEKGHVVITGACGGFPQAAAEGAKSRGGMSIGVSPSNNWGEHTIVYPTVTQNLYDTIIYTGFGEGRNLILVRSADICIFVGGGSGTLMELTMAIKQNKRIAILKSENGIENVLKEMLALSWDPIHPIIQENDPETLFFQLEL